MTKSESETTSFDQSSTFYISQKLAEELVDNKISTIKPNQGSNEKLELINSFTSKLESINLWFEEINDSNTYNELYEAVNKLKVIFTDILISKFFNENFKAKYEKLSTEKK